MPASFSLKVDKAKVLANGTVSPKDSALIVDRLEWNMKTNAVNPFAKAYIIMMDILANNNWERPIYYASTTGSEAYLGLEDYFQLEGFAYRLVPIRTPRQSYSDIGRINSDVLYENLMNVFNDHSRIDRVNNPNAPAKEAYPYDWGGFNDPRVYHSEDNTRLVSMIRKIYDRLSGQLAAEGDLEKAEQVLDKGNAIVPDEVFPYVSVMSNMYGYTQNSTFYMQDYFNLHTPSADKVWAVLTIGFPPSSCRRFTTNVVPWPPPATTIRPRPLPARSSTLWTAPFTTMSNSTCTSREWARNSMPNNATSIPPSAVPPSWPGFCTHHLQ